MLGSGVAAADVLTTGCSALEGGGADGAIMGTGRNRSGSDRVLTAAKVTAGGAFHSCGKRWATASAAEPRPVSRTAATCQAPIKYPTAQAASSGINRARFDTRFRRMMTPPLIPDPLSFQRKLNLWLTMGILPAGFGANAMVGNLASAPQHPR